jgi:hypothetical protein
VVSKEIKTQALKAWTIVQLGAVLDLIKPNGLVPVTEAKLRSIGPSKLNPDREIFLREEAKALFISY